MGRVVACIVWLSGAGTVAAADCAEEVNAAWRRLQGMPFWFEIAIEWIEPRDESNAIRIESALIWPAAMRFVTAGKKNGHGHLYIGPRSWKYINDSWSGGGMHGYPPEFVLGFYANMYGLNLPSTQPHGVDAVACLGRIAKVGREQVAYAYKAKGFWSMVAFHEHHTLYIDAKSGLPVRQEIEKEFIDGQPGFPRGLSWEATTPRRLRQSTQLRPDPTLLIEPPK
jgi:hypothetical protein